MLRDMKIWRDIRRRVEVLGESKRSVQRRYGLHWKTLQKVLAHEEPPGYRLSQARAKRKIGPFLAVIKQILEDDQQAPPKQRHTAKRICERLRAEYGFDGGYTIVKDAVRELRLRQREVFMPLEHPPGEGQVDFGRVHLYLNGIKLLVALFVMILPYSGAFFVRVYPRECREAFLDGHRRAFEFFGKTPGRLSYDNPGYVVDKVVSSRGRELSREFLRLQSHYLFEEHFCLVRRPQEKGHVEGGVGYARRNFLVPVPRVSGYSALNAELEQRCRQDLERRQRGKEKTKGELLQEELRVMLSLPARGFAARRVAQTTVNSLSLVRFDRNDYSAPTAYAYHAVTAVGDLEEVRLIVNNQLVAHHARCWEKEKVFFEPLHYLALLERKPGALDFAKPLSGWRLPDCFALLRRRLEAELGGKGTREYIKVLRLLETATLPELTGAVEQALALNVTDSEALRLLVAHRREEPFGLFCLDGRPHLQRVRVDDVDLSTYTALLAHHQAAEVRP